MKSLLRKFIPDWLLGIYHWIWALAGALIYGWPSRKLKVIGVTGTKGKSTVVFLAGAILRQGFGMVKVGWISSLTINDGKNEVMNPYHMTMPGRFFIQKTLRQMKKNGCEYALVEVTSEGIKQSRHRFIKWLGAVFTNLAPEHLEAHGGFEKYRAAKLKLFEAAAKNKNSFGVYNLDDSNVEEFLKYDIEKKYGYGIKCQNPNDKFLINDKIQISNIKLNASGSEFEINDVKFKTNLLGEFNVKNCAAAVGVALACGASPEQSAAALAKIKSIPGRLEIIDEGQNFTVVVDLAHTPDSFNQVFSLFKNLVALRSLGEGGGSNRIISVFGSAGGGRDKWKRPELGRIAGENSDIVIICNEDPYNEDPKMICDEIAAGCKKIKPEIILDRRMAIARGLFLAQTKDVVLILGKGTEQTYIEGDKKINWDDRLVVRDEIKKLRKAD